MKLTKRKLPAFDGMEIIPRLKHFSTSLTGGSEKNDNDTSIEFKSKRSPELKPANCALMYGLELCGIQKWS